MRATASSKECDKWTLKQGDVLFTKDSETADEIGIPAFVSDDMPNVLCGYHLGRARPDAKVVDGSFLARALGSHQSAREFARVANGITRFGLTLDTTRSLPLLLPPLSEQRAIASVLDSIDEAIERTEEIIAATERLRDALLQDLLTRGLPGRHTEWRQVRDLGTIPACWDVVRLEEVTSFVTSGSRAWSRFFSSDGALFVRSQNISHGRIDKADAIFVQPPEDSEADRTQLREKDLVVSVTGEPGRVASADTELGRAFVSQHVALVRLAKPALSAFIFEFLRGRGGQEQIARMTYGQTRPGLNLSDVASVRIAIPSQAERDAIADAGASVDAALERLQVELGGLLDLRTSIAGALLEGRVRS